MRVSRGGLLASAVLTPDPSVRSFRSVERLGAVATLLLVFSCSVGFAHDFVLNYAVEANEEIDVGKLDDCDYGQSCEIRAAGLNIGIVVQRGVTDLPTIDMTIEGPPGCCQVADASATFHSIIRSGSLQLAIYRRVKRDRDEFVRSGFFQNEQVGRIHLRFSRAN
ncbi:hypothetical protein HL666_16115 [Bradyrhizobium sp. 83002]|nr:hypothetical protein [Bradyrhizobium aeschynomenes]